MALYLMREEWKSVLTQSGVQSVIMAGQTIMMLKLYASSLATVHLVGIIVNPSLSSNLSCNV